MRDHERDSPAAGAPASEQPWSEEPALSPELRALLACAEAVADQGRLDAFYAALGACRSAEALCAAAVAQGMLGHLHAAVTAAPASGAAPGLVKRLGELHRALALRNLRDTSVLLDILDRLEAGGVRAMPVKGPVWAQLLYGDVTLRSWADLDLLVARDQAAKAREVLLGAGLSDCSSWNERMVRSRWGDTGQIALGSRDLGLIVDLHWRLAVSVSPKALTSDLVLARAETVELLGREVTCPGKTDAFLMTCLEGSRDRWSTVARVLDLAVQLVWWPSSEWPVLLSDAEAAGCRRRVVVSVAHVCCVLGLKVPDIVASDLEAEARSRRLMRSLRPSDLSGAPPDGLRARLHVIWWQAAGEDHRVDRVRHLLARLFAPTTEDWETAGASQRREWLHFLLRPGRLVVKWSGHLLRAVIKPRRPA